jgi:hypothetical protein
MSAIVGEAVLADPVHAPLDNETPDKPNPNQLSFK